MQNTNNKNYWKSSLKKFGRRFLKFGKFFARPFWNQIDFKNLFFMSDHKKILML